MAKSKKSVEDNGNVPLKHDGTEPIRPEFLAITKIQELRASEHGLINNVNSLDKLAHILEEYLFVKLHE